MKHNNEVRANDTDGEENRNHQDIARTYKDASPKSDATGRRRKSIAANINSSPTPEALTLGYIAGKSAAKAAREGNWKSPGRPSRKGKVELRRRSIS